MQCWPRRSAIRNPSHNPKARNPSRSAKCDPRRGARRDPTKRDPRRSARPKSKEFAANLRRQTSQRGGAHIHHPLHRRVLSVLHLEPVLRPAALIGTVAALRPGGFRCAWLDQPRRRFSQLDLDQGGGLPTRHGQCSESFQDWATLGALSWQCRS
jgi:hypothetical protein